MLLRGRPAGPGWVVVEGTPSSPYFNHPNASFKSSTMSMLHGFLQHAQLFVCFDLELWYQAAVLSV